MRHSVTIRIAEENRDLAAVAAAWARSANADVDVAISTDVVVLASHVHGLGVLEAIWAAALANEAEHHRHAAQRAAAMDRLFA